MAVLMAAYACSYCGRLQKSIYGRRNCLVPNTKAVKKLANPRRLLLLGHCCFGFIATQFMRLCSIFSSLSLRSTSEGLSSALRQALAIAKPIRNINEVINISSTESALSSSLSKYESNSIDVQNVGHEDCSSVDNIFVASNNYSQNAISIAKHNRHTLVEEVTSLATSVKTRCERICATIANNPLHLHQIGNEDLVPLYGILETFDTTHHKLEGMKTILQEITYEQHGNGNKAPLFHVLQID